jgi:hypothetical protein
MKIIKVQHFVDQIFGVSKEKINPNAIGFEEMEQFQPIK